MMIMKQDVVKSELRIEFMLRVGTFLVERLCPQRRGERDDMIVYHLRDKTTLHFHI